MQMPGYRDNMHPVKVPLHPNPFTWPIFFEIVKMSGTCPSGGPRISMNVDGCNDGRLHIFCPLCSHIFMVGHHYNDPSKHTCLRREFVRKIVFTTERMWCRMCNNLQLRWNRIPAHFLDEHSQASSLHNSETDSNRRRRFRLEGINESLESEQVPSNDGLSIEDRSLADGSVRSSTVRGSMASRSHSPPAIRNGLRRYGNHISLGH